MSLKVIAGPDAGELLAVLDPYAYVEPLEPRFGMCDVRALIKTANDLPVMSSTEYRCHLVRRADEMIAAAERVGWHPCGCAPYHAELRSRVTSPVVTTAGQVMSPAVLHATSCFVTVTLIHPGS
jgi:hypothetical protein